MTDSGPLSLFLIDPEAVAIGDTIPTLRIDVTATLIVGGALASRDFFPGHHDAASARSTGQPDIFMNIMTTAGLITRYLTDWAGPAARVQKLRLKLGVANRPGDVMTIDGSITGNRTDEDGAVLEIEIHGMNERGSHAAAQASLLVPRPPFQPS